MTRDELKQAILSIIQDILPDENFASLDPNAKLRDQIGLDSMDFLDIVMELRKRYGVEVPETDYPQLATLNSCLDYLEPRIKKD